MPKLKKKKSVKKVIKKIKVKKSVPLLKRRKISVARKVKLIKKTIKKAAKKKVVKKSAKKKIVKPVKPTKPVLKKKKIKKSVVKPQVTEFPAEALFKARIKVIGIGGGGGSIVSEIGRSLEKAHFVIADTDIRALKKKSGIKYFWFGEEQTHGLGTGVNIDLARQAAISAKDKIGASFKDQDIIIFIASLGGGLGSAATQVFAQAAREFGGITFGIFTMPFKFEGKNKYRIAQNALKSLRNSLNVSLVIPNEKIFKIIDANTAITNAFSIVNKSLIESLESLIDLIYNPGIINIDFADLRAILRGIGNTAFLNTIEESGKDRAEKICRKILHNPLLQDNKFEAEKILFNIAGAENLSMFEVEKISNHIANTNPKAKIIFGISKNPKLKSKIKTTILMTGGSSDEDVEVAQVSPAVELTKENFGKAPITEKINVPLKPEVKVLAVKKKKMGNLAIKKPMVKQKKKAVVKKKKVRAQKEPVSFVPVLDVPAPAVPVLYQNKMTITEANPELEKRTIRRSGLEIKRAEEIQEKKRIEQEKEWEIPAFLRKVKFKG